jgi:nucleotide-binding universal stress UspA family protein
MDNRSLFGRDLAVDPSLEWAPHHVLVPLNGSAHAERVLGLAVELGKLFQTDYTLLRVYGQEVDFDPLASIALDGFEPAIDELGTIAQNYVNRVAQRLKGQRLSVDTRVVRGPHPASTILDPAQNLGVGLIAMETHGRGGVKRMLLGSVADKLIRSASIPVLIHRSP